MLRTIDRYVIREIIPPFLLSLLIFTFILEIPPVMRHLETLVSKGVTWQIALQIILTLLPQALGVTIPMSLLTGILIGLGRLSSDREAVALLACGVSPYRLLRPILLLAALATGATLYVLIEAIPNANQAFNRIAYEIITKRVEEDIQPRVFFEDFPGWVLYFRDEVPGGGWKDVLVADSRDPKATQLFLAARGRLYLAPDMSRVDLILSDGTQYGTGGVGEASIGRFAGDLILGLDPKTVFPRMELPRGVTEQTIPQLLETIRDKRRQQDAFNAAGQDLTMSPHPELLGLHQKFSLPAACLVFALIGLALGLTVARDGKMAGFVVGTTVIFAYYIVMYLGESAVKGYYTTPASVDGPMYLAHLGRWIPNLVLGTFGVAAIVWRARFAERGLPISIPAALTARLPTRWRPSAAPSGSPVGPPSSEAPSPRARSRVVVVVRFPRIRVPAVRVLDLYVSRLYIRMIGLSFLALLGLFYISTFIDRSDKMFKGQASVAMMFELLALLTPQFVYFVIPIAALLSALVTFGLLARTSELTVMKACGISLYRIAAPIVVLSLAWSAVLFGLEQQILAAANRRAEVLDNTIRGRPTTMFDPLNRRWLIGTDGTIYHYSYFDAERQTLNGLSMYRLPADNTWTLASHTYAPRVVFSGTEWLAESGWSQDLSRRPSTWAPFGRRSLPIEEPDYFHTEHPEAELMTVHELRKVIDDLEASGFNTVPAKVELQRKLAFPFVALVMTLLAIPFGVTTGRRGAIYGIGIGIVIALVYWVVFSIFIALGRAGVLPPPLAAWTPNIIVFACAIYLFLTAKT